MNSILQKIRDWGWRKPKSQDDIAAEAEARRIQDQNLDVRLSQRSSAGQNYQSGRGSH